MIADVREHVAAVLTAGGVPCAAYPPSTVTPPAALLYASDPYVEATQLGASTIGLRVRLVGVSTGPQSPRIMDSHIDATVAALRAAGVDVGPVAAPTGEEQATYLHTDIPIRVVWED